MPPILPPGVPAVRTVAIGGPSGPQGVPGQSAIQRVAASAMSAGQVVRTHAAGQQMQAATTDLRTRPFDAILLGDIGSGATGNFHVAGPVPANVLQLGAGVACAVGVNASGVPVRATDPTCVSAPNWIGTCDTLGNVTVSPVRKDFYDVRDFGAVPDFDYYNPSIATDNLAAFNACFLAARGFNAGGGITERQTVVVYMPGGYYLSGTLEIPGCFVVQGAGNGDETRAPGTLLAFPKNCNGIQLRSSAELPNPGFNSAGTEIRDITLYVRDFAVGSDNAPWPDLAATGSGIYTSAYCKIHRMTIVGFGGDAVSIVANAGPRIPPPDGPIEFAGNADGTLVSDVRAAFNGRHGIFIVGADANIIRVENCQMSVNWGWGYYDVGGGSHYIGCDGSGNRGNFATTGSIGSGEFVLRVPNPYIGTAPAQLTFPFIVGQEISIAGLSGTRIVSSVDASADPANIGLTVAANATVGDAIVLGGSQVDIHRNHDYKCGDPFRVASTVSVYIGCYSEVALNDINAPAMVIGGFLAQDPVYSAQTFLLNGFSVVNAPLVYPNTRGSVPISTTIGEASSTMRGWSVSSLDPNHFVSFDYQNTVKAWVFRNEITGADFLMGIPNGGSAFDTAIFRPGIRLQDSDNAGAYQKQTAGTSAPSTGVHSRGDVHWNTSATTTIDYWKCTVSGTPGTWVARP